MKRFLYYLGIFFFGLSSGSVIGSIFRPGLGIFYTVIALIIGCLLAYPVYRCYEGLSRLKNKAKEPVITNRQDYLEPDDSNKLLLHRAIKEVIDCLSYRQSINYPEIENELNSIHTYLKVLQENNIVINSFILKTLTKILVDYKEIVTSPIERTSQGQEMILEIQNSLEIMSDSIGQIYNAYLDGRALETTITAQALKQKLEADGYLQEVSPFEETKGGIR